MIEDIVEEIVTGWYTIDEIGLNALSDLLKDSFQGKDVFIKITKIDDREVLDDIQPQDHRQKD